MKILQLVFITAFIIAMSACARADYQEKDQMVNEILTFWFDYQSNPQDIFNRALWWQKDKQTDEMIEKRFASRREEAIHGKLDDWLEEPKSLLAYIILIDQFSINLKRNTPEMFEHDELGIKAAKKAVDKQFDQSLKLVERVFVYLPFEHSENLSHQKKSVSLFEQLVKDTPQEHQPIAKSFLDYAKDHHDIIEKFGRFPHRNPILGRESTAEELTFMQSHGGF